MSDGDTGDRRDSQRRNFLLGGPAMSVLAATGLGASTQLAQAQQTPPPVARGRRPNFLVIWGNDVGIANVGA